MAFGKSDRTQVYIPVIKQLKNARYFSDVIYIFCPYGLFIAKKLIFQFPRKCRMIHDFVNDFLRVNVRKLKQITQV
jgi:hypothetical protein